MDDIVPGLIEEISDEFKKLFRKDATIINIYAKIRSKNATYKEANEFAIRCGELLRDCFKKQITVDVLPEGRMWYNIASRILRPTLKTNYSLITDVCNAAQSLINEPTGLKNVVPAMNENRLNGLIDKLSNAENFEDVEWVLDEPIVNYSQSMVDEYMQANAEAHYEAGLKPKIIRRASSGCCKWCSNLAGKYEYPYVPTDVYRRHENCRCIVEYVEDGYSQNVHTKKWNESSQKEMQREVERQTEAQHKEKRRKAEENIVNQLLKIHPDWSRDEATIYYRTQIAPKKDKTIWK